MPDTPTDSAVQQPKRFTHAAGKTKHKKDEQIPPSNENMTCMLGTKMAVTIALTEMHNDTR